MRVLIATTQVPFCFGGAEMHAQSLLEALRREGHEAEIAAIPFQWTPPERIMDHLMACRLLDLTESNGVKVDRVIGLKFPAYHVRHPEKVLWVLHQYRSAFDQWGGEHCDLAEFPQGKQIRSVLDESESQLLGEAKAIHANSRNVAERLRRYSAVEARALYHPPPEAEKFACTDNGEYLFFPSRIVPLKRQSLVIEALKRTKQPVKVVFSGVADEPRYGEKLVSRAKELGLDGRIRWEGFVSQEEKRKLYAGCRGVIFPPVDEDYGYITLEAMLSSKPVITLTDSGGPLEFVVDGETGLVCEPSAEALAAAMDRMWKEASWAKEAGRKARVRYDELNISWHHVVETLLR